MKKLQGFPLLMLLSLLLLPLVFAQVLQVDQKPIKAEIGPKETAKYHLLLTNPTDDPLTVKISSLELDWRIYPDPLSDYRVEIAPGDTRIVTLLAYPKANVKPGPYVLTVTVFDEQHQETTRIGLPVYLKSTAGPAFSYVPSLRVRLTSPYEIDPRQPWSLHVTLENLNPKNLDELSLLLITPFQNKTKTIDLAGRKKTTEHFVISLPHDTPPQEGVAKIVVSFTENNKTYTWNDQVSFRVLGWSNVNQYQQEEKAFLKKTVTILLINNGTMPVTKTIYLPTNKFMDLFTHMSETPYYIKADDGDKYGWTFSLSPKESKTIVVISDYRPLAYFLLLVILFLVLYYILRSPVVVRKDVVKLATTEGGISQIKIIIHLKNRTKRTFEQIKIIEKLPHLVNLEKDFEIGTIAPVSVHTNKQEGTLVKWELSHLDPYEERIITYKISSQLSILGGLSLAPSVVYFQDKKGRIISVKSNRLNLEV